MAVSSLLPWRRGRELAERDPFAAFRREMDSLFDSFFSGAGEAPRGFDRFTPRVDVKESDKEIRLIAELPGMDEKDVEISLSADVLTIRGEKKEEKEEKGEETYRMERTYGAFHRSFALPAEVDSNQASASFKNGVLTITLPKTAQATKTKKIAVQAG
jgi:HSP20 family protein